MSRERQAQLLTLAVLAAVAGGIVFFKRNTAPALTPRDTIYRMLDAARDGDVRKYLAAYTGSMAETLKQAVAESGEAAFARHLRESNAAVKGVALMEPQPLGEREVKLRVEYVYQDRNEVQQMILEKTPAGWRIARVEVAERVRTPVPYGTPVQ